MVTTSAAESTSLVGENGIASESFTRRRAPAEDEETVACFPSTAIVEYAFSAILVSVSRALLRRPAVSLCVHRSPTIAVGDTFIIMKIAASGPERCMRTISPLRRLVIYRTFVCTHTLMLSTIFF